MSDAEKQAKMKEKFEQLDTNGDGTLDFDELKALLQKGNPSFTNAEVEQLYTNVDANHDGNVSFDEFLKYLYGADHSAGRTTEGRHARMAAASGPADDGTELDWGDCEHTFTAFAGKDMDGREFSKFCKDNKLIGHGFTKNDVDIIFAKVVPKGQRRMDFNKFKDACRLIAAKRGQENREIQGIVGSSDGPHLAGTKADAVRFHDDKSTYTGAHSADPSAALGRHERIHAGAEAAAAAAGEQEDDWGEVERVFNDFAGAGGTLEGREFNNMVHDIPGLLGGGFGKRDIDLTFTSVCPRGVRRIGFPEFQDCVRKIAAKKGQACYVVQGIIGASSGHQLHGTTKADAVRFHDDKTTYTGAHSAGDHGDDRHARLAAGTSGRAAATEDENPWEEVGAIFDDFAGDNASMESREFLHICNDCSLFDAGFQKRDVDIIFTKCCPRGIKKLDKEGFFAALRLVAAKKDCPTHQVQAAVASSNGPVQHATKADAVRFHDDKNTYTGAHAR